MSGMFGAVSAAPVSYIFNNVTQTMVVFTHDRTSDEACTAARDVRPDAVSIEAAMGNGIYVTCK